MKKFLAILIFASCVSVYAQTSSCGETSQSGTDSGNAFSQLGTPCATGTNANGYTVSSISYWVGSPTSTSFDLGVYSDSSANPNSLLCSVSTGAITPSAGWNTVNISGCPTLSASTAYWVGYITGSDTIQQGEVTGACPGTSSHSTWANAQLSGVSLANPFPANTQGSTCYSLYMSLAPASALPTPTLTVSSSPNPSTYGQSVIFTATISSGPVGTITFYDGNTSLGTGSISGTTATLTTSAQAAGNHSITASWPGNSSYAAVTSSAITQTVSEVASSSLSYTYDSLGRLYQAQYTTPSGTITVTYSYDSAGNRTSVVTQ